MRLLNDSIWFALQEKIFWYNVNIKVWVKYELSMSFKVNISAFLRFYDNSNICEKFPSFKYSALTAVFAK